MATAGRYFVDTALPPPNAARGSATALSAFYPFTGSAADASGFGNHGTPFDGPRPWSTDRFGAAASASQFDGVDDFVVPGTTTALDVGTGDFSIVAWVRTTMAGNGRIWSKGSHCCTTGYMLRHGRRGHDRACWKVPTGAPADSTRSGSSSIDGGSWQLVVGIVDRDRAGGSTSTAPPGVCLRSTVGIDLSNANNVAIGRTTARRRSTSRAISTTSACFSGC